MKKTKTTIGILPIKSQPAFNSDSTIEISKPLWGYYGNPQDKQKQKVSDDDIVETYVDKVVGEMENPNNKGYDSTTGKYKEYKGAHSTNIGPGLRIDSHSQLEHGKSYTKDYLNGVVKEDLQKLLPELGNSLEIMNNGQYAGIRDTLSMGPLLGIVDIGYNVKSKDGKNLPESFPKFTKALSEGNLDAAKQQSRTGNDRRHQMRNDLLTYDTITKDTVKNRKYGGLIGHKKNTDY